MNSTADNPANTTPDNCLTVAPGDAATSGHICTLRGAINAAALPPGPDGSFDFIDFQIGISHKFVVNGELPPIPDSTLLNGFSVCDPVADPVPPPDCANGIDYVEIVGPGASVPGGQAPYDGLTLVGNTGVFGVVVHGFRDGIVLAGTGNSQVFDSWIGPTYAETGAASPPNTDDGIEVKPGSVGNIIGLLPEDQLDGEINDISGNGGWGVHLDAGSGPTFIRHDTIGTDGAGHSLPNGKGGILIESDSNVVGGTATCQPNIPLCNRNVIAANNGPGIQVAPGTRDNVIAGNFIGTTTTGLVALGNQGAGIDAAGTSQTIGGAEGGAGNVISGNGADGVILRGSSTSVESNRIGVGDDGATVLGNGGAGVHATDADGVIAGGNTIRSSVISGNAGAGVLLDQANNRVIGNVIGQAADKITPAPNAIGVHVTRGPSNIGALNVPNFISDNLGAGVLIDGGLPGAPPIGVRLDADSISANGGLGVDLGGDGVTANDPLDADLGANDLTNFPVLTSASVGGGQAAYHGVLDAAPNTSYNFYLLGSSSCDASGYGEGDKIVSGGLVTTDSSGHANFGQLGPALFAAGDVMTTSVIGPNGSSEFGPCVTATPGVDLRLTQAAIGAVTAGKSAELVLHVTNAGPAAATNVLVTDVPPSGAKLLAPPAGCTAPAADQSFQCPLGTLNAGASRDLHVLLQPGSATLANAARAVSDQIELTPLDNGSTFGETPGTGASPGTDNKSINEQGPVFAQTLRVDPGERGRVTATLPDGRTITITDFAIVPVGTEVDASGGRARVTASKPDGTKINAALYDSSFTLTQPRTENGTVQAKLSGDLTGCGSGTRSANARATKSSKTAKKKKPKGATGRDLWGHAHGPFRIKGRYGAAAARGTIWHVSDHCSSTVVSVKEGVVDVTAVGATTTPRTATVKAGQHVTLRAGG